MNLSDEDVSNLRAISKNTMQLNSKVRSLVENADLTEEDALVDEIEWLYRSLFSLYMSIVEFSSSINTGCKAPDFSEEVSQKTEPEFDKKILISFEDDDVFHAIFAMPPLLKRMFSKAKFAEVFTLSLQKKTVMALPESFKKFQSAYVIYVNHWEKEGAKTPYYDNDNIAIKMILDAIVPYICKDDCIQYCENLYLTINDNEPISELYIVQKGHLKSWLEQHKGIPFVSELTSSPP